VPAGLGGLDDRSLGDEGAVPAGLEAGPVSRVDRPAPLLLEGVDAPVPEPRVSLRSIMPPQADRASAAAAVTMAIGNLFIELSPLL
jgi:hypothetical protein